MARRKTYTDMARRYMLAASNMPAGKGRDFLKVRANICIGKAIAQDHGWHRPMPIILETEDGRTYMVDPVDEDGERYQILVYEKGLDTDMLADFPVSQYHEWLGKLAGALNGDYRIVA